MFRPRFVAILRPLQNVKGNYVADNFPFDILMLIYTFGLASHWKPYSVHTAVTLEYKCNK
jgi:hypothetical protein